MAAIAANRKDSLSALQAQAAGAEVLERSLSAASLCSLNESCDKALSGEGGNEQEQELQAKAWAAVPPPSPAPFKAQFVLHSVKDMASLGSNSTQPTTLGWLWSQAAAAAAVGARLTERRSVPNAANAAAESACEEVPSPPPTPVPPPNPAMQPTSAMQLPAMLGPRGRFASFQNPHGFRIACYFWPSTGSASDTPTPEPASPQTTAPPATSPAPTADATQLPRLSSSPPATSFFDAGAPFVTAPSIPPAATPPATPQPLNSLESEHALSPFPASPQATDLSPPAAAPLTPLSHSEPGEPCADSKECGELRPGDDVCDDAEECMLQQPAISVAGAQGQALQRAPSPFALAAGLQQVDDQQQQLQEQLQQVGHQQHSQEQQQEESTQEHHDQHEQPQYQEQQGRQQGEPCKGVVILFHGHGSHVGFDYLNITEPGTAPCYEGSWVQTLNDAGYSVAAMDHQGMGRSEGHRWYVHAFQHYVDDARAFVTAVHDGVPDVPGFSPCRPFLLATSLGGCIVAHFMKQLEATAGAQGEASYLSGAVLLAPMLSLQAVASSPTNQTLMKIAHVLNMVLPGAAIVGGGAANPNVFIQEAWERDPLTSQKHRTCVRNALEYVRACNLLDLEAASGQADVMEVKEAHNCCWRLPLLIFHSERDSWTDCLGSIQLYRSSGSSDKTLRLLDGEAHLLTRGEEGKRVLDEALPWLDRHAAVGGHTAVEDHMGAGRHTDVGGHADGALPLLDRHTDEDRPTAVDDLTDADTAADRHTGVDRHTAVDNHTDADRHTYVDRPTAAYGHTYADRRTHASRPTAEDGHTDAVEHMSVDMHADVDRPTDVDRHTNADRHTDVDKHTDVSAPAADVAPLQQ